MAALAAAEAAVASSAASTATTTKATNSLVGAPDITDDVTEAITYRTQGFHKKGVFRWIIDNYSHLPQKPKKRTFTKKFNLCGHQWQLSVTPGGEKSDSSELFMSVYLWYQGDEEIETAATIQLVDLNEHDRFKIQHKMTRVMAPYDDDRNGISKARGWAEFAPVSYIRHFAKNDRIVLELQLQVKGDAIHTLQKASSFRGSAETALARTDTKLHKDFSNLLTTGNFHDITFEVDGANFAAHKAIIAIRSPVLAAMFAHNTMESAGGTIPIKDMQAGIFEEILKYIYSAACSFEHPELLLAAADRFCLVDLCEQCAERLLSSLTVDNVSDRLILGHDHTVKQLKRGCLTFIRDNAEAVLNSDGYKRLREARPLLPAEILETIYLKATTQSRKSKASNAYEDSGSAANTSNAKRKRLHSFDEMDARSTNGDGADDEADSESEWVS